MPNGRLLCKLFWVVNTGVTNVRHLLYGHMFTTDSILESPPESNHCSAICHEQIGGIKFFLK
jgi:hypothetical protein